MAGALTFFPGFNPQTDRGLFDHGADVIVNTVNCLGTGKNSRGVAGQVFRRFPGNHDAYMRSCTNPDPAKRLGPGKVLPVEVNAATGEQESGGGTWVWNAATKDDWKKPSQLEWVRAIGGKLEALAEHSSAKRIALPPMGCGEGGLDWKREVGPMLRPHLEALSKRGVEVLVFAEDPSPERGMATSVRPEDNRRGSSQDSSRPASPAPGSVPARAATPPVGTAVETKDWFAGIGARPWRPEKPTGTPETTLVKMRAMGEALAKEGWGLRSGGAAGADDAFEQRARKAGSGALQIFLPGQRFNGRVDNGKDLIHTTDRALLGRAEKMVQRLHPYGDRLSGFAKNAMMRNAFQILGPDLESPSKAAVCYTHEGKIVGGTGFALQLCEVHDVPVINLGDSRWKNATVPQVVDALAQVRAGGPLEPPTRPRAAGKDMDR